MEHERCLVTRHSEAYNFDHNLHGVWEDFDSCLEIEVVEDRHISEHLKRFWYVGSYEQCLEYVNENQDKFFDNARVIAFGQDIKADEATLSGR